MDFFIRLVFMQAVSNLLPTQVVLITIYNFQKYSSTIFLIIVSLNVDTICLNHKHLPISL